MVVFPATTNRMLFPAAAAVVPIDTRTPTTHTRFVEAGCNCRIAVWEVPARVMTPPVAV